MLSSASNLSQRSFFQSSRRLQHFKFVSLRGKNKEKDLQRLAVCDLVSGNVFGVSELASKKSISVINDFLANFELHRITQVHTTSLLSLLSLKQDGSLLCCSAQWLRIGRTVVIFD